MTKEKRILLIPPTKLNGSFGDELMVVSFIHSNQNTQIDIYTEVDRPDLYHSYSNVNFRGNSNLIHWYKYQQIVVLGADNMTGSYGIERPLKKIKILKTANLFKIDNRILGFSLKKNSDEKILRELKKISGKTGLFLRDIDSFERAKQEKFKNITLVSDLAFLTPYKDMQDTGYVAWINAQREMNKKIVGICPNAIHANNVGIEQYVEDFIRFIKSVNESVEVSFVFLYHDLRSHCQDNSDKDISSILFDHLHNQVDCYYKDDIGNGIQMKYYVGYTDLTVTGRMHFGISGLSLGKPMLGITYEDKFSGLQKLFNIEPEESLIGDYKVMNEYVDIAINFIKNSEYYSDKVRDSLGKVKKLSFRNLERV